MEKKDLLKLGLSEEVATRIWDSVQEELAAAKTKAAKQAVQEKEAQIEELKKTVADNEELHKRVAELENENAGKAAEFSAALKKMQLDSAVERAIITAKAKNHKAVKALLDLNALTVDEAGVHGLDEQIERLRSGEDSGFLFEGEVAPKPVFKGVKPAEKSDKLPSEVQSGSLLDAVKMHFRQT